MSVHEKALRLIEGGIVACNDLAVRAVDVTDDDIPCCCCEMGSACNKDMADLCNECDWITNTMHHLELVSS